jgi:hypothetical protein
VFGFGPRASHHGRGSGRAHDPRNVFRKLVGELENGPQYRYHIVVRRFSSTVDEDRCLFGSGLGRFR